MFKLNKQCTCKPLRQHAINKGKSKFSESLNNYNTLRDAIDNQMRQRINTTVAPKQPPRFQIV